MQISLVFLKSTISILISLVKLKLRYYLYIKILISKLNQRIVLLLPIELSILFLQQNQILSRNSQMSISLLGSFNLLHLLIGLWCYLLKRKIEVSIFTITSRILTILLKKITISFLSSLTSLTLLAILKFTLKQISSILIILSRQLQVRNGKLLFIYIIALMNNQLYQRVLLIPLQFSNILLIVSLKI